MENTKYTEKVSLDELKEITHELKDLIDEYIRTNAVEEINVEYLPHSEYTFKVGDLLITLKKESKKE